MNNTLLSLVVPVYNEAETILIFIEKVSKVLSIDQSIEINFIFINDGSTDNTLDILLELQKKDNRLTVIDFTRNFGKESALTAGLDVAVGDIVIPIDVDLQDPPEIIIQMIEKWRDGYDVVLAKRISRDSDSFLKKYSAHLFYRIHNKIANPKIPENVGDFRLIDKCVLNALKELHESNRFMKGLFAWVGFRTTSIEYVREKRSAGVTKFNSWKLWNFALDGITSFSTVPLRIWTYVGFFVSILSFILASLIIIKFFIYGINVPGYTSIIVSISFFSGLQLVGIGIIGEYLGRIFIESKKRPTYLIRNIYKNFK